jgi:hypothetical protein
MKGHIVAEVKDVDNALLIKMVGQPVIETVVSHDITGRCVLYIHCLKHANNPLIHSYHLSYSKD